MIDNLNNILIDIITISVIWILSHNLYLGDRGAFDGGSGRNFGGGGSGGFGVSSSSIGAGISGAGVGSGIGAGLNVGSQGAGNWPNSGEFVWRRSEVLKDIFRIKGMGGVI